MSIPSIISAFDLGAKVIDKLGKYFPSEAEKNAAKLALLKMQQDGDFKELDSIVALARMQSDVNKIEASGANLFVSGWRPFVGWVGGAGLAAHFLLVPLLRWLSAARGWPQPPELDLTDLLAMLGGMLGFGGLRTYEKKLGVAG